MGLETGTYISDLVAANPPDTDPKSQGDDHLRLIKSTLKATFPNITGPVTATQAQINTAATAFRPALMDFRLTFVSGTPIPTTDVTAPTTLYMTPYKGKQIALYDGANWNTRTSAEISIALPAGVTTVYDVFCYDNAGTPTLELLAWASQTARATALVYQDGILVKSAAATRRYLGTFMTLNANTSEDSAYRRLLWNYYNRALRNMAITEATASWTYTTASYRLVNANAVNLLTIVIGVQEDIVSATARISGQNNTAGVALGCAIGLDGTGALASPYARCDTNVPVANNTMDLVAVFHGFIGVGKHALWWLETSQAAGTTTWFGQGLRALQATVWG